MADKQPWPREWANHYQETKIQLETIISLTERAINIGVGLRNVAYLERAAPLIRMLADRLLRASKELDTMRLTPGKRGPYWINDVTQAIDRLAPQIKTWAAKSEPAVKVHGWEQADTLYKSILEAASQILDELLDGPPPPARYLSDEPGDSLIADAEAILTANWGIIPAGFTDNLSRNARQHTRLKPPKRRPRRPHKPVRNGGKRRAGAGRARGAGEE